MSSSKVFISYAAPDRDYAESLKPRLSQLLSEPDQTVEVVDAHRGVGGGDDWRRAIRTAIDEAGSVVIVASPAGDASQWVNYEAGLADALGKRIVIVGRPGADKGSVLMRRLAGEARVMEFDDSNGGHLAPMSCP
jgi:hypothetical protein